MCFFKNVSGFVEEWSLEQILCTFESLESIILLLRSPKMQQQFLRFGRENISISNLMMTKQNGMNAAVPGFPSSCFYGHFGVSHRNWKPTPIYFAKKVLLEFEVAFDFNVHIGRWKHSCRISCDIALLDPSSSCLRWHCLPRFPIMHSNMLVSNNKRYLQTNEETKILSRLIHEKYLNILPSHYVARVTTSWYKFVSSTSTFYCRYVIIRCLYQQS